MKLFTSDIFREELKLCTHTFLCSAWYEREGCLLVQTHNNHVLCIILVVLCRELEEWLQCDYRKNCPERYTQ